MPDQPTDDSTSAEYALRVHLEAVEADRAAVVKKGETAAKRQLSARALLPFTGKVIIYNDQAYYVSREGTISQYDIAR